MGRGGTRGARASRTRFLPAHHNPNAAHRRRYERICRRRIEKTTREQRRPTLPRTKVSARLVLLARADASHLCTHAPPRLRPHASAVPTPLPSQPGPHHSLDAPSTRPNAQYLHESRHLHALNRVRGDKGRFVNIGDSSAPSEPASRDGITESPPPKHSGRAAAKAADRSRTPSKPSPTGGRRAISNRSRSGKKAANKPRGGTPLSRALFAPCADGTDGAPRADTNLWGSPVPMMGPATRNREEEDETFSAFDPRHLASTSTSASSSNSSFNSPAMSWSEDEADSPTPVGGEPSSLAHTAPCEPAAASRLPSDLFATIPTIQELTGSLLDEPVSAVDACVEGTGFWGLAC